MKLAMLSWTQGILDKILALDSSKWCRGAGSETCLDHHITTILNDAEKEAQEREYMASIFGRELGFLRMVSLVQQDGRSCPGRDRYDQLRKLTTDEWRKDPHIIMDGIRAFVISLDSTDAIKLS